MDSTTSATRNPRFTEDVDEITSMFDFSGTGNDSSPPHYLQACFLCSKFLGGNSDIFMYRGDLPFCSEDCRKEQIEEDEAREKKIKLSLSSSTKPIKINKNDSTSNSNAASSSSSSSSSTHTSQPLPLLSF